MGMRSIEQRGGMLAAGAVAGPDDPCAANRLAAAARAAAPADGLTLDPQQFQGDTRLAYEAAQKHPDLLAQLHCYCGCQEHEGHKSLLDCFRTDHGARMRDLHGRGDHRRTDV